MSNEKFLTVLLIVLALFIGALIHTIWLQGKELRALKHSYRDTISFVDKVLHTIAIHEHVDINKYINMTRAQVNDIKEGGENHE